MAKRNKPSKAKKIVRQERARANAMIAEANAKAPTRTPAPTSSPAPKIKGLGQGLRIAGGGYGIGKSELDKIVGTKTDPSKVIRKLDKINAKLSEKDKTGISLKSGAANKLIRKASKLNPFERGMLDFGTGRMGLQIKSMLGDPGSLGVMRQGQRVGAREAVDPTILAKGMDLGPKGQLQVRGVGKQYEVPARLMGTETPAEEVAAGDTEAGDIEAGDTEAVGEMMEPMLPEEEDTSLSSGAGGLDLASWATGFKTARSSRRKAGKGAQGLASMKKSPFTSWFK